VTRQETILMYACYADETARWPGFVSLHERFLDGPGLRYPRPFLFCWDAVRSFGAPTLMSNPSLVWTAK
jgi:hypothetical protein